MRYEGCREATLVAAAAAANDDDYEEMMRHLPFSDATNDVSSVRMTSRRDANRLPTNVSKSYAYKLRLILS